MKKFFVSTLFLLGVSVFAQVDIPTITGFIMDDGSTTLRAGLYGQLLFSRPLKAGLTEMVVFENTNGNLPVIMPVHANGRYENTSSSGLYKGRFFVLTTSDDSNIVKAHVAVNVVGASRGYKSASFTFPHALRSLEFASLKLVNDYEYDRYNNSDSEFEFTFSEATIRIKNREYDIIFEYFVDFSSRIYPGSNTVKLILRNAEVNRAGVIQNIEYNVVDGRKVISFVWKLDGDQGRRNFRFNY